MRILIDHANSLSPGEGGPAAAHWYALHIRPPGEKRTCAHLKRRGIETFLPLLRHVHWWSDRRKLVEVPMFAGYAFVRLQLNEESKLLVLQTSGVLAFVGVHSHPAPVSPAEIDTLRRLLASAPDCAVLPFLRTGQRVRIRNGALDGLEGVLEEKDKRLVVSIRCIQQSVAVRLKGYDLEVI